MPVEKSAGAVVFRRENKKIKYLLIQYAWGHWEFPRGLIEKGESLEDTARREIEEEVGIKDIEFIPGFKEWIKFFFRLKGKNIMKIATFLLAETKTEEVKLSFEHKDYAWLEYDAALERLTFKNSKEILKKANDFLKTYG
jgi:8-oxo-dGTP pyrophosphatase MutT (NUDIX family)